MESTRPRVGLVALSLPRERVDRASFWLKRAKEILPKAGLELLAHEEVVLSVEGSLEAVSALVERGAEGIIYLIGTWIYAPMVIEPIRKFKLPALLWSPPDPAAFSLVGTAVAYGSLRELGFSSEICYGTPEDVLDKVKVFANACKVLNRLRRCRLGLFGGYTMGMYTALSDPLQVKKVFGLEMEHIDQHVLIAEMARVKKEEVEKIERLLKEKVKDVLAPREAVERAIRLYLALKRVISERRLDAVGVKCQPELIDEVGSACLAMAMLNDEGIIASCECDINGAITMKILHLLSGGPVIFADINSLDLSNKELRLINCGSFPMKVAGGEGVELGYQYKYMGKMRGVTTILCAKSGEVTLARLGRVGGEYVMVIARGRAVEKPKGVFKEDRELWPHMFVILDGDPKKLIENLLSNHIHVTYGDYVEELVMICKMLGIKTILI